MASVLLTAFEPYDRWKTNSSWLALVQLTHDLPPEPAVTTRLYPVDFAEVKRRLSEDLKANYDFAIHLGQAPGTSHVRLEAIGINVGGSSSHPLEQHQPLTDDGPVAYRSPLPLGDWAVKLRRAGIPAAGVVSRRHLPMQCDTVSYELPGRAVQPQDASGIHPSAAGHFADRQRAFRLGVIAEQPVRHRCTSDLGRIGIRSASD